MNEYKTLSRSIFFLLERIDIIGKSCSFFTTSQMPGNTNTKLKSKRNNLKFEGIDLNKSIGSESGLGISVGKKGIIGI